MSNKPIEMRKTKRIFQLYSQGISKRQISLKLSVSRNTVAKYISFFKRYKLTAYEVEEMTLEELDKLFPYFDKELRKTGVTKQLLWEEYYNKHPDGFKLSQFRYWYREWSKDVSPVMHFTHKAGDKLFIDYTGKSFR